MHSSTRVKQGIRNTTIFPQSHALWHSWQGENNPAYNNTGCPKKRFKTANCMNQTIKDTFRWCQTSNIWVIFTWVLSQWLCLRCATNNQKYKHPEVQKGYQRCPSLNLWYAVKEPRSGRERWRILQLISCHQTHQLLPSRSWCADPPEGYQISHLEAAGLPWNKWNPDVSMFTY